MNENTHDTTTLHLRLSEDTAAQIESLAQARGQDRAEIAGEAVRAYVAFEAAQLAKIHRGIADADAGRIASPEEVKAAFNRYRAYRAEQAG